MSRQGLESNLRLGAKSVSRIPLVANRRRAPVEGNRRMLTLSLRFLDGQFRCLEAHAAVGAVAEWLVDRGSAAAKRKRGLAGEVVGGAVDVDQFDCAFGGFDAIGAVGADGNFDLRHAGSSSNLADF